MGGLVQRDEGDEQISNTASAVRFAFAILVVLFHVCAPNDKAVTNYFEFEFWFCLLRLLVPLFFIFSSFFHYRKTGIDQFDLLVEKRYLAKLIRLYITWTVIYFPLILWGAAKDGKGLFHNCMIVIRNFLFYGSYLHLWYLHAAIISAALVSGLLYLRVSPKRIVIVASAFYFAGLFAQSWFGFIRPLEGTLLWGLLKLVKKAIISTRNGLFVGFLFTGMGMLYAFYDIPITKRRARAGCLISMALMLVEALTLKKLNFIRESDVYFFLVPTVFFLFAWIRCVKLPDSEMYRDLQALSAIVYYIHVWVLRIVDRALSRIGGPLAAVWVVFFVTLAVTLVFSMAILKLSDRPRLKWLKRLYS